MSYDPGDFISLRAVFTDFEGRHVDPTSVTCKTKDPSATILSHTPIRDSVGIYHWDLTTAPLAVGTWWYRFDGTGVVVAGAEQSFTVVASQF